MGYSQLSLLSKLSQDIVLGWDSLSRSRVKVVWWWCWGKLCFENMWMNYIYAKWKWKKQCFEIIAQKITAKNINNDLVFFRDEIKIFLISWFETRSRFVSSTSRASRRDREFVPSNLEFRDGDDILKKISCGRARYLVAKSHEIFRDRDISPCSGSICYYVSWYDIYKANMVG